MMGAVEIDKHHTYCLVFDMQRHPYRRSDPLLAGKLQRSFSRFHAKRGRARLQQIERQLRHAKVVVSAGLQRTVQYGFQADVFRRIF